MKCTKGECEALHLGSIYPMCQYRLGANCLGSSSADKDPAELDLTLSACGNEGEAHTKLYYQECRQWDELSGYFSLLMKIHLEQCVLFQALIKSRQKFLP